VKLLHLLPLIACVAFQASARNYTTIDFPGANATEPFAINSNGDIVGTYSDSGFRGHGFLLHSGTFTTLDFPGAEITEPTGINVNGVVVGTYFTATTEHGFLWHNGTFTTIDAPGATGTFAEGINDLGDVVGVFTTGFASHGFLLHNGTSTNLDAPFPGLGGLAETLPWGINSQGDIVGGYIPFQTSIGFFLHAGVWNSISVGGAGITFAREINSQGDIAGSISDDVGFHGHGFVIRGGTLTMIDFPGVVSDGDHRGTQVNGINDHGDVVGRYDLNQTHGFVSLNQQTVSIVIKPGEVPASINTHSRGTIPVAILSAANFDATSLVDRASLTFGHSGNEHSLSFCHAGGGDVNGDGLPDLICHFTTQLTGFQPGETMGVLNGKISDGTAIQGMASIQIVH
jgi:probable HAF family extracellular repeat protein